MKRAFLFLILPALINCTGKKSFDPAQYLDPQERHETLAMILAHILDAPPYTKMEDRLKPEHLEHYRKRSGAFSIDKYFIADDGTHYFLVFRPGPKVGEQRMVGGHFKIGPDKNIESFREIFVTPLYGKEEAGEKGNFLFKKLVEGNVDEYLKMKSYVQWPNEATYYDTLTYEWKLKPEAVLIK